MNAKFEPGRKYYDRFLSDGNYWVYSVWECIKRTEKTVTFRNERGEVTRKKILNCRSGSESVSFSWMLLDARDVYDPETMTAYAV